MKKWNNIVMNLIWILTSSACISLCIRIIKAKMYKNEWMVIEQQYKVSECQFPLIIQCMCYQTMYFKLDILGPWMFAHITHVSFVPAYKNPDLWPCIHNSATPLLYLHPCYDLDLWPCPDSLHDTAPCHTASRLFLCRHKFERIGFNLWQ